MGRPIKKKFFGNTITPYQDHATSGKTGVGGEGVASIAGSGSGGSLYSQGSVVSIAAPGLTGGIQATVTQSITAPGGVITISVNNPGSGYLTAPAISVAKAATVTKATTTGTNATNTIYVINTTGLYVGMKAAGTNLSATSTNYVTSIEGLAIGLTWPNAGTVSTTVTFSDEGTSFSRTAVLTSTRQDSIRFASTLTGGTVRTTGDILKQEGSHRYLIQNTDGKGICKLVATADADLLPGEMNIVATDYNGNTYYVTKLTARKARLVHLVNNEADWLVADGGVAGWTIGAATATKVSIAHTN